MLQKKIVRHMSRVYVKENMIWDAQNAVLDSNINYNCSIAKHR
jgi:hypothetical protein